MSSQFYPVLFMLSSTFSLSLTALLSKYLNGFFDASLLSFLRFILPALIILGVLSLREIQSPTRDEQGPLWLRAFSISACQVCFIYALEHLSLVESVVLFSTGPLFIPMLEKLIFNKRLNRLNVMCLLCTFLGVLLLAGQQGELVFRLELLVGLAAGVFNAGSQLSLYCLSKSRLNAFEINLWTFLRASVVLVPLVGFGMANNHPIYLPSLDHPWGLVAALMVLAILIINTQVCRSKAYALASSSSQLAPLIFTNLLFTAAWQSVFYDQQYTPYQAAGLLIILFANIISVMIPKRSKQTSAGLN
ncbi:DMT family transporter [Vibrio ostreicida]|uniref:DMT family transporter n=1 Tax=Vibrio ostreicida TaxID=526588 RepID=UPI003B5BC4AC